jgi:PAS domain S-box-containing protein
MGSQIEPQTVESERKAGQPGNFPHLMGADGVTLDKALLKNLERLDLVRQVTPFGIWDWDINSGAAFWSPEQWRLFAIEPFENGPLYETWRSAVHPDDREAVLFATMAVVADPARSLEIEYRIVLADGTVKWLMARAKALCDENGKAVRVIGLNIDVTARKCAEEKLRDSEGRFRALVESTAQVVWTADGQGATSEDSPSWRAFTGQSYQEFHGWGWLDAVHPDDRELTAASWRRSVLTKELYVIEYRLRHHAGGYRWTRARGSPMLNADGSLRAWVGMNFDITAEREAAAALRASEARMRSVIETATDAILVAGSDGKIVSVNPATLRIFGYEREEDLLGQHLAVLMPGTETMKNADLPDQGSDPARAIAPERELMALRCDGSAFPIELSAASFWSDDKLFFTGVVRDITQRRSTTDALRASEAALRGLNETLELDVQARTREIHTQVEARREAEMRLVHAQRMDALGQLAGGIAHDFNNVLQAIQCGVSLMNRRLSDPGAVQRLTEMITDAIDRGSSVTRRLIGFARQSELQSTPINSAALIEDIVEVLKHTLGRGIEIRVEADPALPPLFADQGQLETVLINLATNARDAMPKGGLLTFTVAAEIRDETASLKPGAGAFIRINVMDTGNGMDAATLARASEPFFTTKQPGKGSGLGLAMARGFVEQSGGAMAIASEAAKGASVTLWLPQAKGSLPTAVDRNAQPAPAPTRGHEIWRIMLVDDQRLVRGVLAAELEEHGYAVVEVEDGDAALALLDAGEPVDLVVSDLSMPGMDGIAFIRAAQHLRPGMPAILLTGYIGEAASLAVDGALSGSFSLLRKPVSGVQLADRAAALLTAAVARADYMHT